MLIGIIAFLIIIILTFVNGITDATNSVATIISTNVMSYKRACYFSAFFDVIGLVLMFFINSEIADSISEIVSLPQNTLGVYMLCISMISTIIFSCIAMAFGIPTSESHGLIAGLIGIAASFGGMSLINFSTITNVLIGLVWAIFITLVISIIIKRFFGSILAKVKEQYIKMLQVISCALSSFSHGAQDGLKFVGLFYLLIKILDVGNSAFTRFMPVVICSLTIFLGVSIGGRKIIRSVGESLVKLDNKDALIADFSTSISVISASLFGYILSTTHAKTLAIVGTANKATDVNFKKLFTMFLWWIFTFIFCGLFSFLLGKIVGFGA